MSPARRYLTLARLYRAQVSPNGGEWTWEDSKAYSRVRAEAYAVAREHRAVRRIAYLAGIEHAVLNGCEPTSLVVSELVDGLVRASNRLHRATAH